MNKRSFPIDYPCPNNVLFINVLETGSTCSKHDKEILSGREGPKHPVYFFEGWACEQSNKL